MSMAATATVVGEGTAPRGGTSASRRPSSSPCSGSLPLALLAMNAVKTPEEYLMGTGLTPPEGFSLFDNLARAWAKGLGSGFVNSLIYGVVSSVVAVIFAALAAYGIVRLKIPRGLFWFLLIYSGTVFPFQMYLIPLFNLYLDTGLYDTRLGHDRLLHRHHAFPSAPSSCAASSSPSPGRSRKRRRSTARARGRPSGGS